jgi:hypothetical protein
MTTQDVTDGMGRDLDPLLSETEGQAFAPIAGGFPCLDDLALLWPHASGNAQHDV